MEFFVCCRKPSPSPLPYPNGWGFLHRNLRPERGNSDAHSMMCPYLKRFLCAESEAVARALPASLPSPRNSCVLADGGHQQAVQVDDWIVSLDLRKHAVNDVHNTLKRGADLGGVGRHHDASDSSWAGLEKVILLTGGQACTQVLVCARSAIVGSRDLPLPTH
jgi:hypothetical protein